MPDGTRKNGLATALSQMSAIIVVIWFYELYGFMGTYIHRILVFDGYLYSRVYGMVL